MSILNGQEVVVHTGNILENEELVRTVGKSTLEELRTCIKATLNNWNNEDLKEKSDLLAIRGVWNRSPHLETLDGLKTTVKIFLSKNSAKDVGNAIEGMLRELRMVNLNTVIIVPPDVSDDFTLKKLAPVWIALEDAVSKNQVSNIGIADLSVHLFKELFEWSNVKPALIQLNQSSCCAVPTAMTEFAKSHDIQVLTHNDDPEVLDEQLLATVMSRVGLSGSSCEVRWLARHRSIETCYGLVNAKGYTISLISH